MSKFKYLTILLHFCLFCTSAAASQVAIVVSKNATIYAHPDLTGPIGVISKGKKLHASESIVANGKALPFQLGNKVAFISLDDVITENAHHIPLDKAIKEGVEHEVINYYEKQHENDFTKDNYFVFELGKTMFLQGDWVKLNNFISNNEPELARDISIYAQHRPKNLRHYIAVGINYISQETDDLTLSAPLLVADLFLSPLKTSLLSLDLGLSIYGTGDFQVKVGFPKKRFIGTVFGGGPKMNIRFFPNKMFGFHISARYQYFRILNLENMEIPGVETKITINEMNNASILVGISFKLM